METLAANLFFTVLVVTTVAAAFMVVCTLHIVRSACWLLLSLTGAAGLFFFLGADFVGATQLLIYVGGTLVLVIFGVMLTATGPFITMKTSAGDWVLAIGAGALLLGVLGLALADEKWGDPRRFPGDAPSTATTQRIGMALLGFAETPPVPAAIGDARIRPIEGHRAGYLLPFEIVSVHLLVVLIGAAYLARAKRSKRKAA